MSSMAGEGAPCRGKEGKEEEKEEKGLSLTPVRSPMTIWDEHDEDIRGFNEKFEKNKKRNLVLIVANLRGKERRFL